MTNSHNGWIIQNKIQFEKKHFHFYHSNMMDSWKTPYKVYHVNMKVGSSAESGTDGEQTGNADRAGVTVAGMDIGASSDINVN